MTGDTASDTDASAPVHVSVIIPHFNDLDGLDRCLDALMRQRIASSGVEIIVADNNSTVGEKRVEERIAGRAKLIIAPEQGAGPARNAGVAASRGRVLAFIDSDCVAEPDWLASGLAALDRFDVVGGKVRVLIDHDNRLSSAEAFERVFAFDNEAYVRDKGFTGAGNMFCRRSTFDLTGPFRVGMSEDLEWSRRATAAGFTLGYDARAVVGHPARRTWAELERKWLRIQSETYALKPPTVGNRLRWLARAWLMPASIIAHIPRIVRSSELNSAQQRLAAMAGLTRLRLWRLIDAHRLAFGWRR